MLRPDKCPLYYRIDPPVSEAGQLAARYSYHVGTALTYLIRAGRKTIDPREDYRKAINHLKMEINLIESASQYSRLESFKNE